MGKTAFTVLACLLMSASAPVAEQTIGLFEYDTAAYEGFTLFAPLHSEQTFLIDMYGREVHTWESEYIANGCPYLLENGNLMRASRVEPGGGGLIQEIDWDGNVLWSFTYFDSTVRHHHDFEPLPNGNVLILAWEFKSREEAIAAGRDTALIESDTGEVWPEHIVEVEPIYPEGGNIVWEWHLWDHLIQDFDSTKANYGVVADHPELVDLNFAITPGRDWLHANAVDYNPQHDQVIISCRQLSEYWIIDHSTTTPEAASHEGGISGKGGDLLYRWGNPQVYDRGGPEDQKLILQHDAQWIEPGLPGAGNILLFSNGGKGRLYSTVEEIEYPCSFDGQFDPPVPGDIYGPDTVLWSYQGDSFTRFYSPILSGATRLANGNTLICSGITGHFFEVTPEGEKVWEYINPVGEDGAGQQGDTVGTNRVFRCYRYPPDYPGLQGRDLLPGSCLEVNPIRIETTVPESAVVGDSIVVTAVIASDEDLASVELLYELDSEVHSLAMTDDGLHHDALPGDNLFGVVLPPVSEPGRISFFVRTEDNLGQQVLDPPNPPDTRYRFDVHLVYDCGDIDHAQDGVTVSDVVFFVSWLFDGGPPPVVFESADCNGSGGDPDIADLVHLVEYMFRGGPPPWCEESI